MKIANRPVQFTQRRASKFVYASPGEDRIAIQLPECIYENENLNGLPHEPVVLSSNAPVYGAPGEYFLQPNEKYVPSDDKTILAKRYAGLKRFELKDHLGSVRATVADAKIGGFGEPVSEALPVTSIGNYLPYGADIKSLSYFYVPNASSNYPFIHGKSDIMPIGPYSFGFDGMKREGKDIDGNYNTAFRQYEPNTGRWWSLDPKKATYPSMSPYCFAGNNPINAVDKDGQDIYLIIWATYKSKEGIALYGHAAIAVSNYNKDNKPDGTLTYYDLWPGKDTDGDGNADEIGSANADVSSIYTDFPAYYQNRNKLNDGTIITENILLNGNPCDAENKPAQGVIKLYSNSNEDKVTKTELADYMKEFRFYNSRTMNCSDFAAEGVSNILHRYKSWIELYADELIGYCIEFTTPNGLYKYVRERVTDDPKLGKEIKKAGDAVEHSFKEIIIQPAIDEQKKKE